MYDLFVDRVKIIIHNILKTRRHLHGCPRGKNRNDEYKSHSKL